MALGAGADRGVLPSAGAMALGAPRDRPSRPARRGSRGRALRWAGRLLAVALIACGLLLALDGILAV